MPMPRISLAANRLYISYNSESSAPDIPFEYADADAFLNELGEQYSYKEEQELYENARIFTKWWQPKQTSLLPDEKAGNSSGESTKRTWTSLSLTERRKYYFELLDSLELSDDTKRLVSTRAILYLFQGCFIECSTPADITTNIAVSVYQLYEMGVYPLLCSLLAMELYSEEACKRAAANPEESSELRFILSTIYTLIETLRREDVADHLKSQKLKEYPDAKIDSIRLSFIAELGDPIYEDQSLPMVLFNMITRFCSTTSRSYPVHRVLLLLWKTVLAWLGGWDELRAAKNRARVAAGLATQEDDTLLVAQTMRAAQPPLFPVPGESTEIDVNGALNMDRNGMNNRNDAGNKSPFVRHPLTRRQVAWSAEGSNEEDDDDDLEMLSPEEENPTNTEAGGESNPLFPGSDTTDATDVDADSKPDTSLDADSSVDDTAPITVADADAINNNKNDPSDDLKPTDARDDAVGTEKPEPITKPRESVAELIDDSDRDSELERLSSSSSDDTDVSGGGNGEMSEMERLAAERAGTPLPFATGPKEDAMFGPGERRRSIMAERSSGQRKRHADPSQRFYRDPAVIGGSTTSLNSDYGSGSETSDTSGPSGMPQPAQQPERREQNLSWIPKIREKDIEQFLEVERMKFFGYELPHDSNTTAGFPQPIKESVKALQKHIYVSLTEIQTKQEERYNKYIFSQKESDIEDTPAEQLYRMVLPQMPQFLIALLRILLAAAPTTRSKHDSLNINFDIIGAAGTDGSIEDSTKLTININRHKEIIVKSISALLLLLLKHFKVNHVYQFEYVGQHLVFANCIPLILKFFDQNILSYVQSKNEIPALNFPACVLYYAKHGTGPDVDPTEDPMTASAASSTEPPNRAAAQYFLWRNMFSAVNLLRILNKVTKWKRSRTLMLVVFKSAPILKRALRVKHILFQLFALKLLKMQAKYLGRQWRKTNMEIMSAIYSKVRHRCWLFFYGGSGRFSGHFGPWNNVVKIFRLNDDWAFGNETNAKPWHYQIEELFLKSSLVKFNTRRYGDTAPNNEVASSMNENVGGNNQNLANNEQSGGGQQAGGQGGPGDGNASGTGGTGAGGKDNASSSALFADPEFLPYDCNVLSVLGKSNRGVAVKSMARARKQRDKQRQTRTKKSDSNKNSENNNANGDSTNADGSDKSPNDPTSPTSNMTPSQAAVAKFYQEYIGNYYDHDDEDANDDSGLLDDDDDLSDAFKRHYDRWLQREVFQANVNWDQLLTPGGSIGPDQSGGTTTQSCSLGEIGDGQGTARRQTIQKQPKSPDDADSVIDRMDRIQEHQEVRAK